MAKSKKKKKQHTIPQSYLKGFTYDGYRLFVFDKHIDKAFASNTRDVANTKYFYDFPDDVVKENVNPQIVEDMLQVIDGEFPGAINAVVDAMPKQNLPADLRLAMATLLVNLCFRTPKYRDFHIHFTETMLSQVAQIVLQFKVKYGGLELEHAPEDYRVQYDEEAAPIAQANSIFGPAARKAAEALCDHIWVMGVNRTTSPFYTSDSPVVMYVHRREPGWGYGLLSKSIEVAFPLDSTHILCLFERTFHSSLEHLDGKAIPLCRDAYVTFYNSLQVQDSYRQVYCASEDFDLAREVLRECPDISIPEWHRAG